MKRTDCPCAIDIDKPYCTCEPDGCFLVSRKGGDRCGHCVCEPVQFVSSVSQADLDVMMAKHYSADKPPYDQIPVEALDPVARVFLYGQGKYGRDNWKKGTKWHEFVGSALRHIYSWYRGERVDPESGCLHLAHAVVNLMFLMYYEDRGIGEDDRDKRTEPVG